MTKDNLELAELGLDPGSLMTLVTGFLADITKSSSMKDFLLVAGVGVAEGTLTHRL